MIGLLVVTVQQAPRYAYIMRSMSADMDHTNVPSAQRPRTARIRC